MNMKWCMNCASIVGRMHLRNAPPLPCQDSVKVLNKNNVNVMVLSDGCGSAIMADKGSLLTVNVLSEFICENFDFLYQMGEKELKMKLIDVITNEIKSYINNNKNIVEDAKQSDYAHYSDFISNAGSMKNAEEIYFYTLFDATVQFVASKDDKAIVGRLGDGVIGCVRDNSLMILSSEDKVGVEDNVTVYPSTIVMAPSNSMYSWDCFEIIKIEDISKYSMFFIVSDGVADVIVGKETLEAFLYVDEINTLISKKDNLLDVLENMYRPMKGIWDDLSIALMDTGKVSINNIIVREYDELGHTINNSKTIFVNNEENLESNHDIDIELSESIFGAIDEYIEDIERKEFILGVTKKLNVIFANEKKLKLNKLKEKLSAFLDELEIEQVLLYLDKCSVLTKGENDEIILKGEL